MYSRIHLRGSGATGETVKRTTFEMEESDSNTPATEAQEEVTNDVKDAPPAPEETDNPVKEPISYPLKVTYCGNCGLPPEV